MRHTRFPKLRRKFRRNKGDVFFFAGLGLILSGTVAACVATVKSKEELEKLEEDVNTLHEQKEDYTEENYKKEITKTYIFHGGKVARNFLIAGGLTGAGVVCLTRARCTWKGTIFGLGAALNEVTRDFNNYRNENIRENGRDADRRMRFGIQTKEVETEEDVHGEVQFIEDQNIPGHHSIYAKIYDSSCNSYTDDPSQNRAFLVNLQDICTDRLRRQGFLFLNDVYDSLGIPRTAAGQVVGWCLEHGDDYVDFGLYEVYRGEDFDTAKARFLNGYEPCILLDFNVYGDILNIFPKYARF